MARNRFRGDADTVAQITKFTVTGAGGAGDTVVTTINRKDVTATVPAAPTTTTVAAAIAAALAASTVSEFKQAVWTSVGADVFGTASTPGMPFGPPTVAVTGTVTVGAVTTPTPSAGPNHWDTARNWTLNAVPVSTDDVDLLDCAVDILWGLDQTGVTLASLNIYSTYTGRLGLPVLNALGYAEYRTRHLTLGATAISIGIGSGSGSSRLNINTLAVQTTLSVAATGSPATQGSPVVSWLGTHASNVVTVFGGYVGIASDLGTVATVATLNVGTSGVPPTVFVGPGVTLGVLNTQGGTTRLQVGATTITHENGTVYTEGNTACNVTTYALKGGTFVWNAPGTITTMTATGGRLDCTQDPRAKTLTNSTFYHSAIFDDPNLKVSQTNPVSTPDGIQTPMSQVGAVLNWGRLISVKRT